MSTKENHRKRSHRSHRKAGYAAGMRKRAAAVRQYEHGYGGLFHGLFYRKPGNGRMWKRIATGGAAALAMTGREAAE